VVPVALAGPRWAWAVAFRHQLAAVGLLAGMGRDSHRCRCEKGFSHQRPHPFPTRPGGLASFWPAKPSAVRLKLSKIRSVTEQRAERFAALRSRPRAGSRRFAGASVRFVVSGEMIPASEAGRVPRTCHVPGSVDWAPDRDGFAAGRSRRLDLPYRVWSPMRLGYGVAGCRHATLVSTGWICCQERPACAHGSSGRFRAARPAESPDVRRSRSADGRGGSTHVRAHS
jgi:hypothetical protein